MAHYLLRFEDDTFAPDEEYRMVEADSARQAVELTGIDEAKIQVWTLRSGEPRTFEVSTESVRTVKLV